MANLVALVLSELVTNALRATWRLRRNTPIGVRLLADSDWLVVEVWDGVYEVPQLQERDLEREINSGDELDGHGNGLWIVATECHQWGYFYCPEGGKIVYAVFAR